MPDAGLGAARRVAFVAAAAATPSPMGDVRRVVSRQRLQRLARLAGGGEPRRRIARQEPMDEGDEIAGAVGRERRRAGVDSGEHVALAAGYGRGAGEQLAQHDAERPAVADRADVAVDGSRSGDM